MMFLARLISLFGSERRAQERRIRRGGFRPVLETLERRQRRQAVLRSS